MKFFMLFVSLAMLANGVPHAYLGSGKVVDSCENSKRRFVSFADWGPFDYGVFYTYKLKFLDSGEKLVVADYAVISDKADPITSNNATGTASTYEDCPGRDICEGYCCVRGDGGGGGDYSADDDYHPPHRNFARPKGIQKFPNRTEITLQHKNGDKFEISYTVPWGKQEKRIYLSHIPAKTRVQVTGKLTKANGCVLRWDDQLYYSPVENIGEWRH